jgi:hypothetical protein
MAFVGSERESSCRFVRTLRAVVGTLTVAAMVASVIAIASVTTPVVAIAQTFTVDGTASDSLTNYLRQNRLPLVGAQIGTASTGARRLVLYGYVATETGKSDAQSKAVAYMGSPSPDVVNRILIKPDIANMRAGGQAGQTGSQNGSADNSQTGSVNDYAGAVPGGAFPGESIDQVMRDIQRYGIQSPPDDVGGP